MRCLAFIAAAYLGSSALAMTPADAVRAAVADCQSLDAGVRAQMRYLQIVGTGSGQDLESQLEGQAKAIGYVLNSVSRARAIAAPRRVGPGGQLVRLDLAAYADFRHPETYQELFRAWEQLAEADPYFHIRTQVVAGESKQPKTLTTDGGWVDLTAAGQLKSLSTSFGGLLRADYFAAHAAGDKYFDWAGIPAKETDFFKLFGLDTAAIGNLSADSAANLLRSAVTRKPRRIIWRPGAFGGVWQSKDVDAESPDRDPIRNPIDTEPTKGAAQKFNFQASEFFALGANRLWRVAMYDGAGKRADTVPDKVAKDTSSPAGDGIVRCMFTCVRCHERNGGSAGLQPFRDDQTDLAAKVGIKSYLPEVAQRLAEVYDNERLGIALKRDREDYTLAVAHSTGGMTPAQATDALAELYGGYLDEPVTPQRAAVELGIDAQELPKLLSSSRDTMTLAVAAGLSINRAAWETCFGDAALNAAETKKQQAAKDEGNQQKVAKENKKTSGVNDD